MQKRTYLTCNNSNNYLAYVPNTNIKGNSCMMYIKFKEHIKKVIMMDLTLVSERLSNRA